MNILFIFAAKYLFVLPVLILIIFFLRKPRSAWKQMAIFAIPAGLLSLLLGFIANHLYVNPRPFVVDNFTPLIPHAADNGFPSDHTLLVATIAMIGTLWNRKMGVVLWILALIVGLARVYVGLHHLTDVLGSIVISIIAVQALYLIFKNIWHKEIA